MSTNTPKKTHEEFSAGGVASSKARSEAVLQRLRNAMALIDAEIQANDGVYPGGRLNQREVCRRADVHYMTLQQPTHKNSTKLDIDEWLKAKKNKTLSDTRKAVTERADYWKEQHRKVATQIHIYKLELAEKNACIAELEASVDQLKEQISLMQKSKVTVMSTTRNKKE